MSNEIRTKREEYLFLIANTEDKPGAHGWSFLDNEENNSLFLFDFFITLVFLNFIVENYKLILNKVIKGMKNMFIKHKKV